MPLELKQTLEAHTERVWTVAWSPSGNILASSGCDKTICLWALVNDRWACVSKLTGSHDKSIRSLCWSPCGNYLASASFDSTVCIWKRDPDDSSWSSLVNLEGHENEVKCVSWSHDGQYLATCGRDRTVWIWERSSNIEDSSTEDLDAAECWDCSDVKNDHTKDVKHLVWHPTQNILVSCSYDDTAKLFTKKGDDWNCFETLHGHASTVWSADFSSTGQFLATCSDDKTIRIWKNALHERLPEVESKSWKCVSVVQGYHSRTIYDISWSKLNDIIVSGSGDNSVTIYSHSKDESTQDDIFICVDKVNDSHDCDINCIAWSPKVPELLVSGGDDQVLKIWTYTAEDKGRRPLTVVETMLKELEIPSGTKNGSLELSKTVTDYKNLLTLLKSIQDIQNELDIMKDKRELENLFSISILDSNLKPIKIFNLKISEEDYSVDCFETLVFDENEKIYLKVVINVDRSKFKLMLPRRSASYSVVADEIFIIEKTGDLFKILPTGESKFLLGHLFTLSDIIFMKDFRNGKLRYIISADRDEKLRITSYPDTHLIERFCFGHKSFVRSLIVVDEDRFISIDLRDVGKMWSLSELKKDATKPLSPIKSLELGYNTAKRLCSTGCAHGDRIENPVS